MLVMQDIMDYSGHVSARIPGTDRFLIQPRDTSRAALKPEDMLVVTVDGELIEGKGPFPAETAIHRWVYKARPDVQAVCHGHPPMSTLFTTVDRPMVAVRNFAFRFRDVPIHWDATHIRNDDQGAAVARTLGPRNVCLLRAHGTVVAATTIPEVFMDCIELEENARSLTLAAQLGRLVPISDDEARELKASFGANDFRTLKIWEHYLHKAAAAGVL
jgi:ribulose-5-phosphate 4-epimerase/fuculose-1-phosphate aldolase